MNYIKKIDIKLIGIMIITILSRAILLGEYPDGIHADEAYAAYEAYSMLMHGTDSWGYVNPVYLTVWGSGMSTLESYMMMPFIAVWGLNMVTIRLPQMIMGCLSVIILYLLIKKVANKEMATWAGLMLAICPWHVMMCRWGLDANLAPAFILLGMYFFVLGLEKDEYFIISSFFWGMSLYCYALMWIFVPAFLVLSVIYCMKHKKIRATKYSVCAVILLGILALPLMLFVLINMGILSEIRTSFISIPKLVEFRSDELTLANVITNIRDFLRIYIKQYDYNLMNGTPYFGLYYLFSLPFIILGGYVIVRKAIDKVRNNKFGYEGFVIFWVIICTAIGLLRSMSIYRANCMNVSILIVLVVGIHFCCTKISYLWCKRSVVVLYLVSFFAFQIYYFTDYQESIREIQLAGADEALDYAVSLRETSDNNTIRVTGRLRHPQVLFYQEYPTEVFMDTVEWENYPAKWLSAESFGYFLWDVDTLNHDDIYIICEDEIDRFKKNGFTIRNYEFCAVAVYKNRGK